MSRILFCSLSSDGFLVPLLAIARRLRALGHDTAFVASQSDSRTISESGSTRIPRGAKDGASFEMRTWSHPYAIAMQLKHLEHGIRTFQPDILVSHQLSVAPVILRQSWDVPLAVLGIAAYIWPATSRLLSGEVRSVRDERVVWQHAEMLAILNRALATFGMGAVGVEDYRRTPFVGDLFLLQSVRELCSDLDALPPQVRFVGSCQAPLPHRHPALEAWLEGARALGRPIVYVQGGRTFGDPNYWAPVLRVLAKLEVSVVASRGRLDCDDVETPGSFFVERDVPQDAVLPHAALAIGGGHTTSTLGAVTNGIPSLLFPTGSGTVDISERIVDAGAAIALRTGDTSDDEIAASVRRLLADIAYRRAAEKLAARFAHVGAPDAAASYILDLHRTSRRFAAI